MSLSKPMADMRSRSMRHLSGLLSRLMPMTGISSPLEWTAGHLRGEIGNGNEVEKPVDDGGVEHRRKQPCESETATKAGHLR